MKKSFFLLFSILLSITVLSSFTFAKTHVSGLVSGTWTIKNHPYIVDSLIYIPYGDSLNIESGIVVLFKGNYQFNIEGTLKARGTETDSIRFTTLRPDITWGGIKFWGWKNPAPSVLEYCVIEKSHPADSRLAMGGGIYCEHSDVTISHCHIHHNTASWTYKNKGSGGIFVYYGDAIISHNLIAYNSSNGGGGGGGIAIYQGKPTITYNKIIWNHCEGQKMETCAGAIHLVESRATIHNNLILNNSGIDVSAIYSNFFNASIYNNTIVKNSGKNITTVIDIHEGNIYNNIIYSNENNSINTGNEDIYLWNNCIQDYNNLIDLESENRKYNFNLDPQFVDPEHNNYHLMSTSPCIDTGTHFSDYSREPHYNGRNINLGCYGNTPEAMTSNPQIHLLTQQLEFEKIKLTQSITKYISLVNNGQTPLTIALPFIHRQDRYTYSMDSINYVFPKDSLNIPIKFSPWITKRDTIHLTIYSNDMYTDSLSVMLTGEGVASQITSYTLKKDFSPYIICDDLIVPYNDTLIIEPGVIIKADTGVSIICYGGLIAQGTQQVSIIITSLLRDPNFDKWKGIILYSSSGKAIFKYCRLSCAYVGISSYTPSINIQNSLISYCKSIGLKGSIFTKMQINNSVFEHMPTAVYFTGSLISMQDNVIKDVNLIALIRGNATIINNAATKISSGVSVQGDKLILKGNTFTGTGKPWGVKKRYYCLHYDKWNGIAEALNGQYGLILPGGDLADVYFTWESWRKNGLTTGDRDAIIAVKAPFESVVAVPPSGYTNKVTFENNTTYVVKTQDGGYIKLIRTGLTVSGNYTGSVKILGTYIPKGKNAFLYSTHFGGYNVLNDGVLFNNSSNKGHLVMKYNTISNFANRGVAVYNTIVDTLIGNKIYGNGDAGFFYHAPLDFDKNKIPVQTSTTIDEHNEILNNSSFQFINSSPLNLDIPFVFWGAEDSAKIDEMILDKNDLPDIGKVNFIPFLDALNNPLTKIQNTDKHSPFTIKLIGLYPNPANPTVKITFDMGKTAKVDINIYNILGQHVKTLSHSQFTVGSHTLVWDGLNDHELAVPSGVYIVSIQCDGTRMNKRLALVR